MAFWNKFTEGMKRSRDRFEEQMNVLLDRGPDVDEEFWEGLEEALILSDVGASAASDIIERMRDEATRKALPDAYAVMDTLEQRIAETFTQSDTKIFDMDPVLILFVGINGSGKTTTCGKLAYEKHDAGRTVLLGSADTFRAAAIEQLEVWSKRANVEMVMRERGADPASVCYDTIERAEAIGADCVLIDTAGRLHTSDDLMRELQKVVAVVRKRSTLPVKTVLVIDATTGQNGMNQAREFNRALDLDGLIVTKLDGTAKGGIALAVSHELELPIEKIGVGEGIEDLRDFDANDFAAALIGNERHSGVEGSEQPGGAEASAEDSETPRSAVQESPQEIPSGAALLCFDEEEDGAQRVSASSAEASAPGGDSVEVQPAAGEVSPSAASADVVEDLDEPEEEPEAEVEPEEEPEVEADSELEEEFEEDDEVEAEEESEDETEPEPAPETEEEPENWRSRFKKFWS